MSQDKPPFETVWLEVANVRLHTNHKRRSEQQSGPQTTGQQTNDPQTTGQQTNSEQTKDQQWIAVQLRGDKDNRWWDAPSSEQAFKTLLDAMEKKRPVQAELGFDREQLKILDVVVMFVEPPR